MRKTLLLAGAVAVLVATGVAHGLRTDRWGPSGDVTEAARRLEDIPVRVGDWSSQPAEINARHLRYAQVAGHFSRRYVHEPTRREVMVLVVAGRPGAIGAHSPDVCYQGAGFRLATEEKLRPLGASAQTPEFSHAVASKGEPRPEHLSLWWAWSADGASWQCPVSPRGHYWRSPVLYKIYFVRSVGDPKSPDDLTPSLIEELLPKITQALSR